MRHDEPVTSLDIVLDIGTLSRSALTAALGARGVGLNQYADMLLSHEAFGAPAQRSLRVVALPVRDLGLPDGARLSQVFAAADGLGLGLLPPETGPYLRLAMVDQASAPDSVMSAGRAPTGAITVASQPLSDDDEYPKGFYLRTVDGRPWLRGYLCDDEHRWASTDEFAFEKLASRR